MDLPHRPVTVSVKVASQMLGVSVSTLYGLLRTQQLVRVKVGRRTLVTMRSIDAFPDRSAGFALSADVGV